MTAARVADRRRRVDAMGLGPLWVLRSRGPTSGVDVAEAADPAAGPISIANPIILGSGVEHPEWLVIADTPDADDPGFAGPIGKLFDAMLAAVGFSRDRNAHVALTVRGSASSADEASRCRPHLAQRIASLAPRLVVAAGPFAVQALLDHTTFDQARGRLHRVRLHDREVAVVATFHPEHLIRFGEDKAGAWADLCLARSAYDEISASTPG